MGTIYSTVTNNIIDNPTEIIDTKVNENKYEYEYLVFSGGGVKGVCYAGVLDVLEKNNILYDTNGKFLIKGLCGTSIGALIASLIAIGYKPAELKDKLLKLKFESLLEHKNWHYLDAIKVFESYGLNSGDKLYNMLGEFVKEKMGDPDYTIKQLYTDKNIKLVIVGTNMNCGKTVYFCPKNPNNIYSNIPIRLAIRISICVPFLFKPIKYKDDIYLDGGILDNYPIHVFDGDYPGDIKARLHMCEPNMNVLGFHIVPNDEEIDYSIIKRVEIKGFTDFFGSFINTFLYENDRRLMVPSYWKRTVNIITPAYPLTQLALTDEQKEDLIKLGIKYTDMFFNKKNEIKI